MAATVKMFSFLKTRTSGISASYIRNYSLKIKKPAKIPYVEKKFDYDAASLQCRGFLRPTKPYDPPYDAREQIKEICKKLNIPLGKHPITDPAVRFSFLNECFQTFKHSVPNSILHTIQTVGDVIEFYQTPVDVRTPYDTLKTMDLPKNLHLQADYHRFHPATDTMFGGISAFPKSSTLVTGLRFKKKYPGYIARNEWPFTDN